MLAETAKVLRQRRCGLLRLVTNPPGVMRLSSPGNRSGITVRKPLSGAPGALTISTVLTA